MINPLTPPGWTVYKPETKPKKVEPILKPFKLPDQSLPPKK